jgi:hypothetical protein
MCRWTSSFTELGTCANEDALDRYNAASLNAGEGEYKVVILTAVAILIKCFHIISKANTNLLCNQ